MINGSFVLLEHSPSGIWMLLNPIEASTCRSRKSTTGQSPCAVDLGCDHHIGLRSHRSAGLPWQTAQVESPAISNRIAPINSRPANRQNQQFEGEALALMSGKTQDTRATDRSITAHPCNGSIGITFRRIRIFATCAQKDRFQREERHHAQHDIDCQLDQQRRLPPAVIDYPHDPDDQHDIERQPDDEDEKRKSLSGLV